MGRHSFLTIRRPRLFPPTMLLQYFPLTFARRYNRKIFLEYRPTIVQRDVSRPRCWPTDDARANGSKSATLSQSIKGDRARNPGPSPIGDGHSEGSRRESFYRRLLPIGTELAKR